MIHPVTIDTVGKPHVYSNTKQSGSYTVIPAATWVRTREVHAGGTSSEMKDVSDSKWMGPQDRSFPWKVVWEIGGEKLTADNMTIKLLTRAITYARMKPPACQEAWEDPTRLGPNLPFQKIWKIKSFFTTPRDEVTWLKLMHRNLWVANRDKAVTDPKCGATGCNEVESMIHLAVC